MAKAYRGFIASQALSVLHVLASLILVAEPGFEPGQSSCRHCAPSHCALLSLEETASGKAGSRIQTLFPGLGLPLSLCLLPCNSHAWRVCSIGSNRRLTPSPPLAFPAESYFLFLKVLDPHRPVFKNIKQSHSIAK